MNLPRYPEYKDSGVGWLKEVPAHWEEIRLGAAFRETAELGNDELPILSVSIHDGVSDKELDEAMMDRKVTRSDDRSKYKLVRPGDLTYNMMRAWQGGFGAVTVEGQVSPAYVVARPTRDVRTAFIEQLLRTPQAIEQMRRHSRGVTDFRLRLYWEEFKNIRIALPSLREQDAILDMLAGETGKIDALIAEQEKLLTLLAEKRQATISHAVTRGLNSNAPMKDSGVPWLGEVPAHWAISKCGRYLSILSGFAFPSSGFSQDENDVRLLRGVNVGVSTLRWDDVVYWRRETGDRLDTYELNVGDLVIGMDRPLIADGMRVARVKEEDLPCLLLQRVASIKVGPRLNAGFLMYLLASDMFVAHFSPETSGVSVPHISPDQIASFVVPIPEVEEQAAILLFLDAEVAKLDALEGKTERAIALLKERRSALIAATVTGKIDVRCEA